MRTVNSRAFPGYFVCCAALLAGCSDTGGPLPSDGGGSSAGSATGTAGSSSSAGTATSAGMANNPSGGASAGTASGGSGSSTSAGSDAGGTSAGGQATAGTDSGTGGSTDVGGFGRPKGQLPNVAQDPGKVHTGANDPGRDKWKEGLVSPDLDFHHHHGQPIVLNGYLGLMGNEEYWFWDITDPTKPKKMSEFFTPNREPTGGEKKEGEAESHTVSFARYGDKFYLVTTGGHGVDIWDVTNQADVKHVQQLKLSGINYGDFTAAVWGLSWQGDYIYVGATDQGVFILDAHDPTNVTMLKRVLTSDFGGVSAGPLDAIGNVLVITTPKESGGIATMDISDPVNPKYLDSIKPSKSYIGMFYRHFVFLQSPVRAWDVLTDPSTIGTASAPIGSLNTAESEYMSFSDNFMFLGHLRPNAGASKIDVSDPAKGMSIKSRVWGRLDRGGINDDQFTIAIGSYLVMGDDESPYQGTVIGIHSATPDTTPPVVDTVIPKDKATGQNVKSRIGITFTDNIELATVNAASFIVRPVGGAPLKGKWGLRMGVVNFDPDEDLKPATTYEVVLPQGGITDLVRNGIAAEFKSTFTTK
jgi:hypothetical protein